MLLFFAIFTIFYGIKLYCFGSCILWFMSLKIKVLGLGGTFQQGFIENVLKPKYSLDEIISKIFSDNVPDDFSVEQIVNKDSNNLNQFDINCLLTRIHECLLDVTVKGIIVVMGTDRMVDISSLVEFSVRPLNKAVIFTGSMFSIEDNNTDVYSNFNNSVILLNKIIEDDMFSKSSIFNSVIIVMGGHGIYAHSSFKLTTDSINSFVCSWNKPACIFGENIKIISYNDSNLIVSLPRVYRPKFGGINLVSIGLDYEPDVRKLIGSDAIVYVGTGDGNISKQVFEVMHFISSQYNIPQFLCSNVPLRVNISKYEAGIVPDGVKPSILPVHSTVAKLAVILNEGSFLRTKSKQRFVLDAFDEDLCNEFKHLKSIV